jgi:hypothetical protein
MNIVIKESQHKFLLEQSMGGGFTPQRQSNDMAKINKEGLDHNISTIFQIASAFIPVVGPFISAGIGLLDAAQYYKEGDKESASLTAVFSMIPFIGKIPGVKELGSKGMSLLSSKLSKGVKTFSPAEIKVLNAIKQNESLVKQGLENASAKLTPVTKSVVAFKPKFIAKYGQQRYDELLQSYISNKITKEGFLNNLKSASGNTSKFANFSVQGGIKFLQSELKSMDDLVPYIKNGTFGSYNIKLNINGVLKDVDVVLVDMPKKNWEGLASGTDKIFMNVSKLKGATKEKIKQTLYHEAAHIKDPSMVSKKLRKSYMDIQNAEKTQISKYKDAYNKSIETGKGADEVINAGEKYKDLYQRYLYHPQEIIANNQMVLNNMTSELNTIVQKFGTKGAKNILDELVGYTSGKNTLSKEALGLLGNEGVGHLNGLYRYNKKYYQDFIKKIAKQSEYLKSQLNLLN